MIKIKGKYRGYFHIGKFGIKFAKINKLDGNPFLSFLSAIIMNILERKRYKYYVLKKPIKQWGNVWTYTGTPLALCPVYFTCGLFNIVKHLDELNNIDIITLELHNNHNYWNRQTGYLLDSIDRKHFKKDENGNILAIDYGDFMVSCFNRLSVSNIDYR